MAKSGLNHEDVIQRFLQNPPKMFGELECSREVNTNAGRIDILCKDNDGIYWIIEAKPNMCKEAIGQLLAYQYCWTIEQNILIEKTRLALLYNVEDPALMSVYLLLGIYLIKV